MKPGFVLENKEILRTMIPKKRDEFVAKEKLPQADIDKMLQQMPQKSVK